MGKEIKKYIKDILTADHIVEKNTILKHQGPMIIYGMGETGRRVYGLLKKYGVKVDYFLDIKGGKDIFVDDIPVFKPCTIRADRSASVIVAIFSHTTPIVPIMEFLKESGYVRIIPYPRFYLCFANELPVHYWLGPADLYESSLPEITTAYSLLTDQESRDLFISFLRFRLAGDPTLMPPFHPKEIYFPTSVPGDNKPDRFIDCGAFTGDTLKSVKECFGVIKSIRAFEPDPNNYEQLMELSNKNIFSNDTVLYPFGVWSSAADLSFESGGALSSGIIINGPGSRVKCVSLDECLAGFVPSLIKMDIEGSEEEALKGCRKLISANCPDLAISVYHRPHHLWRLLLLINEISPNYKFYLRSHGANGYDTVLYARNKPDPAHVSI